MKCPECSTECTGRKNLVPRDKKLIAKTYKIPFYCETCGAIKWKYRALLDLVFIWPVPPKDTYGEESLIEIPTQYKEFYPSDYGIVLSIGPGYYDDRQFHPTPDNITRGMKVLYDKQVPYEIPISGNDGKEYTVKTIGYQDIKLVCPDE